jgi:hypothetical protein
MKSTLLFFVKLNVALAFFFISISLKAQYCGVGDEFHQQLKDLKDNHLSRTSSISPVNGILYIPITVHFVKHSDGTFSKNASVEPFYHSLMSLNRILMEMHVQFYVNGNVDYINNDAYLYPVENDMNHKALLANYVNVNTANVWIFDGWSDSPSVTGIGGPNGVQLADLSERTVIHEFGHFFTLMHTFDYYNGIELVTRTGGNCTTAGDGICDTDADPSDLKSNQVNGSVLTYKNCIVTSSTRDANNQTYTPPFDNTMSYYDNSCGLKYTTQQYARMESSIPLYHSGYSEMQGSGISAAPSALKIISYKGYDEISWINSVSAVGTIIEYSIDGGANWNVMNGVTGITGNQTSLLLSNVFPGKNYSFRARHLNSIAYSSTITYSPTVAHAFVPIINYVSSTSLHAIGGVELVNTNLNNQSNSQDNYSLNTFTTTPTLLIGGTYTLNLKVKTNAAGYFNSAYFFVYIDENKDGDFDDAGELKYNETKAAYPLSVSIPLIISSQASTGYTRMRIRSFAQNNNYTPTLMYCYSETEDYIVQMIADTAPVLTSAIFNQTNKSIDLNWSDNTDNFNYTIERSMDGILFTPITTTTSSTPKTFSDINVNPNQQYAYRIKHTNSSAYSNIVNVVSGQMNISYCTPVSSNGCGSGYGIQEFAIPSISFINNTATNCGFSGSGYSDAYPTKTITLVAGQSYSFTIQNNPWGGVQYFDLYFDTNQNGAFDSNEKLINYSGSGVYSGGSFTVPVSSLNGYTRLRIRGYLNPITDACTVAFFGETEDYKVLISGGKEGKVINPLITNVTKNQIAVSWSPALTTSSSGYNVKISTDGTTYSSAISIPNTQTSYTFTGLTPNTQYFIQIVANGATASDPNTVWATTLPGPVTTATVIGESENEVFVYPNPVSGLLTIHAKGNATMINSYGQIVKTGMVSGIEYWDVSDLSSGIYFFYIQNDRSNQVVKVIKQ